MRIELQPCATIPLEGGHLCGFSSGPDRLLYTLICMGPPDSAWVERREPCDWRILSFHPDGWYSEQLVRQQISNFNLVQPLNDGLILATARCQLDSPNGHVFDKAGAPVRQILLGDGIADLQATNSGQIWASYFDEGVFGESIGQYGLLCFDDKGTIIFRYHPPAGLDTICDCYCLNVVSAREAWCSYYTEFPIVRICDGKVADHWQSPVEGVSNLAIWQDSILLQAGYHSDNWHLLSRAPKVELRVEERITFHEVGGEQLPADHACARGDSVWFVKNNEVYHSDHRDWNRLLSRV
ncbi:MAG: hypothetical protein K2X03_10480 [Bryobacteraceae bacterium]|nr:hypothetical protein [Bryobacteraceae bacterium]